MARLHVKILIIINVDYVDDDDDRNGYYDEEAEGEEHKQK
jgi:hypothetical protein